MVSGTWRTEVTLEENCMPIQRISQNSSEAKDIREEFKNLFMSPDGEVSWQYKHI